MGKVIEAISCYHCGDDCYDEQIFFNEKYFCCHGCKAVYELIQSGNLSQYYENQDLKTSRISDSIVIKRKFGVLDHPEVADQLIRFKDDNRSIARFYIAAIHCSSCIYLLEHLPKLKAGILRSEVNFLRKEVTITFDHHTIDLKEIAVLLSGLGYEPSIQLDLLDQSKRKIKGDSIGLKIAIAGFCFGNSMLVSLPAYLDTGFQLDPAFRGLFGWINLLLMIPIVTFSANSYFVSAWKGLTHRYLNIDVPIVLGIITLFLRSGYEVIWQIGPGYADSLTGLVFFLLIGKWYQGESYESLSFERDYTSYFPVSLTKVDHEKEQNVMVRDLKIGDLILIHNQELIPADGVIVKGSGNLDYSFVTGESELVSRQIDQQVFAGGRQVGAPVRIRLTKTVNSSELTQLWNSNAFAKEDNDEIDNMVNKISQYFTVSIIFIALVTGIYWMLADSDKIWNAVTAVLIVACPCALALALPFSYGHAMRVLGKRGVYLKNARIIENLSKVREIIFDKTGTLTQSKADEILFVGERLPNEVLSIIKTATSNSSHPYSQLISKSIHLGVPKLPIDVFQEELSKGLMAVIQSRKIKIGSGQWMGLVEDHGVREARVYVELDNNVLGYYAIRSSYRTGIFSCLEQLRPHYRLHLLSGDNDSEKERLTPYFDTLAFNLRPNDKLEYLKKEGGRSLMIGDGLNDAGALKSASVGFAVSEDIYQFSPSSDAILSASAIRETPKILQFSKSVMVILILAFIISFLYNITGLSFAVTGNLSPVVSAILMPISSITVVGFITLAVNFRGSQLFK